MVPPTPKELTAASRVPRSGHGSLAAATRKGEASSSSSGLGLVKWTVGTICPCSSISTVLISPATPDTAPVCPMFPLTAPSRHAPVVSVESRKTSVSASTSTGSPSRVAVPCAST